MVNVGCFHGELGRQEAVEWSGREETSLAIICLENLPLSPL